MLTEAYIEALLIDEELADLDWALWKTGVISDEIAADMWGAMDSPGDTT